jgi:hypothetical protein
LNIIRFFDEFVLREVKIYFHFAQLHLHISICIDLHPTDNGPTGKRCENGSTVTTAGAVLLEIMRGLCLSIISIIFIFISIIVVAFQTTTLLVVFYY